MECKLREQEEQRSRSQQLPPTDGTPDAEFQDAGQDSSAVDHRESFQDEDNTNDIQALYMYQSLLQCHNDQLGCISTMRYGDCS
jgi:hypothetical protein